MKGFLVVIILLLWQPLDGHAVDQVYADFSESEDEWSLVVTFDIGLVEEDPGNPETPQKPRDYLFTLSGEEHAALRYKSEQLLRSVLELSVPCQVSFPDYDTTPYSFPDLAVGGAYLHVKLQGKIVPEEDLVLKVAPGVCPLFVIRQGEQFTNVYITDELTLLNGSGIVPSSTGSFDFHGFVKAGFIHVLPAGWDHVLFVVGLCLLQLKLRPVLWQSLLFTVAHSITLALAANGVLPAGGRWVEIFIAASIAAVGFSSLKESELHPWRMGLVFVFGLIHGMGFAGALAEPLQASSQFLPALASLNLGVELAQVVVILSIFALFYFVQGDLLRKTLALLVGLSGVILTLSRLLAGA